MGNVFLPRYVINELDCKTLKLCFDWLIEKVSAYIGIPKILRKQGNSTSKYS